MGGSGYCNLGMTPGGYSSLWKIPGGCCNLGMTPVGCSILRMIPGGGEYF